MLFKVASTVDRYAGAHGHFSSSGFDAKKIITLAVVVGVIGMLVFFAYKNK